MNLQAKLTLGYVLLAVAIVSIISGLDLSTNMQQQFEATLERAEIINPVATKFVKRTLNSRLTVPLVRVIVWPALIRHDINPILPLNAKIALFCVAGAMSVTLLFSAVAFRPLAQLRKQLDSLAKGAYEPGKAPARQGTDVLSVMA